MFYLSHGIILEAVPLTGVAEAVTSEASQVRTARCCGFPLQYVERVFGILSNKCRILRTALNVSKEFSKDIVKARVLLYTTVRSKDGYRSEEIYMT